MKYKCNLCNKEFKQKSHYDVHKNKKYSCIVINDVNNNISKYNLNESQMNHSESLIDHNESLINNSKNSILCCNYCSKSFTIKTNLTRHLKLYCDKKNEIIDNDNTVKLLLDQNKQIIDELNKLIGTIKDLPIQKA